MTVVEVLKFLAVGYPQVFTFALLSDPYLLQGKTYGFDKDFLAIVRRSATPIYQEQNFSCRADQVIITRCIVLDVPYSPMESNCTRDLKPVPVPVPLMFVVTMTRSNTMIQNLPVVFRGILNFSPSVYLNFTLSPVAGIISLVLQQSRLQTAASLVRLILTEFIIGKIITIAVPLVTKLVARIRKQPYKKIELDLPNKMAGLLYFVSLCLSVR